ncbi:hypothetical protein KFK09_013346 [Dendrobium nobile]|uniref:Reverse transcriptase Ty1/copia-type domain-containing protein n=1 Tax=Dendrobium nobile TaxID=94219 RepID=A0A8T3B8H5_DENNO|nr:hypothetical protein KFK09_013346 [Dendrobium nobile]
MLLTGNYSSTIQLMLAMLKSKFSLKQLGSVSTFLGIQVQHTKTGLFLHQQPYARELLHKSGFASCKPAPTPMAPKPTSSSNGADLFHNPSLYRKLAGSLMYLTITRPDIAFATNHICQYMHQPTNQHY